MSPRPHKPAAAFLLTLLCAVLVSPQSAAQTPDPGDPIIFNSRPRQESSPFGLRNIQAALEVLARYTREQREGPDSPKTVDTETIYEEILLLSADAFIIHPNFIDMSLFGQFRLTQEEIDSDTLGRRESNSELLTEFDLSATLLRNGDYPFTIYGRRSQIIVDRQFADSLDNTITEYGARLSIRSDRLPTTIAIFRREQEQISQVGVIDYASNQDTIQWQSKLNISRNHSLDIDYLFDIVDETGTQRITDSFNRHDVTIVHEIDFGAEAQHTLRAWLNAFSQTGDFGNDRVRLEERLELRHTVDFETNYFYSLNRQSQSGVSQTQHRAYAGFQHDLYDSLTTTGQMGASFINQSDGFSSDELFGDVNFSYRKEVPYGRMFADLSYRFNRQVNAERTLDLFIIDEPHTFLDPDPVVLNRRNILVASIVITDSTGLRIFVLGLDYTVIDLLDRVEIRRIAGGAIADGEVVLIDFRIGPEPGNTITSQTIVLNIRYTVDEGPLAGLALFLRIMDLNRDVDAPRTARLAISDVQNLTIGAEYRGGGFELTAEHEINESQISPFEATRFTGRYTYRGGPRNLFTADATHDIITFKDGAGRSLLTTVSGRWQQQLSRDLHMNLRALWRAENDRASGTSQGFDQEIEFRWRHRQTEVFVRGRNSILETDANDSVVQSLHVGVTRLF